MMLLLLLNNICYQMCLVCRRGFYFEGVSVRLNILFRKLLTKKYTNVIGSKLKATTGGCPQ